MNDRVMTIHGAGGLESMLFLQKVIRDRVPRRLWSAMEGGGLDLLDDGSYVKLPQGYLIFTSDTYTVNPRFFPGGDIGGLVASGVINDLVAMGARPLAFMDNIVIEEGFPLAELEFIVSSMIKTLEENDVALIGGDFKVMPRGQLDGLVIGGFGIGVSEHEPIVDKPGAGDAIIVTNYIAEHGATILAAQLGMLENATGLRSDARPLAKSLLPAINKYRPWITAARDPTRGGLIGVLYEWINGTDLSIELDLASIPVREEVREFLEMVGVDPLTLASEGVMVLAVREEVAKEVASELEARGERPSIIGKVYRASNELLRGKVIARTEVGGKTLISPNVYVLPRIC